MKKTTTTLTTIAAMLISLSTMAGGLYFVSGGDFRPSYIKYTVQTTNDNQTVNITPTLVYTLSNFSNPDYTCPWSLKTMDTEYGYGPYDNIGVSASNLHPPCSNAAPYMVEYPHAGTHLVKLYDDLANIYNIKFDKMAEVTSLYIDWSNINSTDKFGKLMRIYVMYLYNCKSVFFGNPANYYDSTTSYMFTRMSNCTHIAVLHPEVFTTLGQAYMCNCAVTNDAIYINATGISDASFFASPYIEYASFPKAQTIGKNVFNILYFPNDDRLPSTLVQELGLGLKTFGVGDSLQTVGQNALWRQVNLETIEFTTSQENWIEAWNNHAILPNWFGPAAAIEGKDDEATLTPFATAPSIVYSVTSEHPKPTKLKLKR